MTILQFANNALSALASPITSADTTIYLQAGTGSLFPTPTSGQVFLATIYNSSSTSYEIVLVTARSGDTVTVVRAQENTTAQTWLTGNSFGMYPTKGTMENNIQIDQLQLGTYTFGVAGGTANALTSQITSNLTVIPDGFLFVLKSTNLNTGAATLQLTMGSTILPPAPIVKGNGVALEAGNIAGFGYPLLLLYSASNGFFILQNPSAPSAYSASYLVVGGGGGANGGTGGGGAGGVVFNASAVFVPSTTYNIIVGAGGSYSTGSNSVLPTLATALGGGFGAGNGSSGGSGGSGGGGGSGGSGTSGQGFNGGSSTGSPTALGGGGGATANGGNGGNNGSSTPQGSGGGGGAGVQITIGLTTPYYGGGGGGCGSDASAGYGGGGGGIGGGGNGSDGNSGYGNGTNGTANTGGGSGGRNTGVGGSGVVIIWYTGAQRGTGGTVTTSGTFTIHTFTTSGIYTA